MQKFVKKPVVIEAIQYDGINITEVESFVGVKLPTVWLSVEDTQLVIPTAFSPNVCGLSEFSTTSYVLKNISLLIG